jgi:hypothetical protein
MLDLHKNYIWRSKDYQGPYSVVLDKVENDLYYTRSLFHGQVTLKVRPAWALLTCISLETHRGESSQFNRLIEGNLTEVEKLELGGTYSGVVEEVNFSGQTYLWNYSLEVLERKKTEVLKTWVDTFVVLEKRFAPNYESEMILSYSPELRSFTHYQYHGSRGDKEISVLTEIVDAKP